MSEDVTWHPDEIMEANWAQVRLNLAAVRSAPWRLLRNRRLLARNRELLTENGIRLTDRARARGHRA